MRIDGYLLDGKTSERVEARLEVVLQATPALDFYCTNDSTRVASIPFGDATISSRLGNTPRDISFNDGHLFVTEDNDAVDELVQNLTCSKHVSLIHRLESNLPLIFISVAFTVIFIWSVTAHGIPKAAQFIAFHMPEFVSEKFGSELTLLDKTLFDPSGLDDASKQEVLELVSPYVQEYKYLNPNLNFRKGLEYMGPNAFALPGGEIVFTDDFVVLAENNEELLAVFFHELGHLHHKHMTRRALQDIMVTLVVLFVTGDLDTLDVVTGIPTLIVDLAYSREFEREADTYALEQMHKYGIELDNFAVIMQRLQDWHIEKNKLSSDKDKQSGDVLGAEEGTFLSHIPDFISTHPATQDRIELVKQFKLERGIP